MQSLMGVFRKSHDPDPTAHAQTSKKSRTEQPPSLPTPQSVFSNSSNVQSLTSRTVSTIPALTPPQLTPAQGQPTDRRLTLIEQALKAKNEEDCKKHLRELGALLKTYSATENVKGLNELMNQIRTGFACRIQTCSPAVQYLTLDIITAINSVYLSFNLSKTASEIDSQFLASSLATHQVISSASSELNTSRLKGRVFLLNEQMNYLQGKKFEFTHSYNEMLKNFQRYAKEGSTDKIKNDSKEFYDQFSNKKILCLVGKSQWNRTDTKSILSFCDFLQEIWNRDSQNCREFRDTCFNDRSFEMILLLQRLCEAACYDTTFGYRDIALTKAIDILNLSKQINPQLTNCGRSVLLEAAVLSEFNENKEVILKASKAFSSFEKV